MSLLEKIYKEKPDKPLYHYTSLTGLTGIIASKSIWASKIQYLNDESEYKYPIKMLREKLLKQLNPNNSKHISFMQKFDYTVWAFKDINVFVCCFSEERDLLSQWRGYCPPEKGFNIGFNYEQLTKNAHNARFKLLKCRYNKDEQYKAVEEFIESHQIIIDQLESAEEDQLKTFAYKIVDDFMSVAPILKDPSFEEEKEWRLVFNVFASDNNLDFREGKYVLIPYYKYNLENNNGKIEFDEITIGPSPHNQLVLNSLGMFLMRQAIGTNYKITSSTIPYRDW